MRGDYRILMEDGWFELEREVNEMLADGYVPMGGVRICEGRWTQAVFKKARSAKERLPAEYSCPEGVDERVWGDYLKHRREKHKGMTPTAYNRLVKQLGEWHAKGHDINKALVTTIRNGWIGVFMKDEKAKVADNLDYVADDQLEAWAKRVGAPAPKAAAGYTYATYREDLKRWKKTQ